MKYYSFKGMPISDLLNKVASAIDISDELFEAAEKRYENLSEWLGRDESKICHLLPKISPQGSFLLGTVTRPITDIDAYDIDLVCGLSASGCSQKALKDAVGKEVRLYNSPAIKSQNPLFHLAGSSRN